MMDYLIKAKSNPSNMEQEATQQPEEAQLRTRSHVTKSQKQANAEVGKTNLANHSATTITSLPEALEAVLCTRK